LPLDPTHNQKIPPSRPRLFKKILAWYSNNKRDLPWRRTRDPYRIWVSEIMLQQTQVKTVIPYYLRFLKQYPSVKDLGRAPLKKILKSWEGMGYYQRARNLHQSAKIMLVKWSGKVPSNPGQLETLPGVGRSTAGAIASIAFGKRAPILDGNVRRVLSRMYAIQEDPKLPHVQNRLWEISEELLPDQNVGLFNQALMDLGAIICLPKNPSCLLCPMRTQCQAYRLGLQERIPVKGTTRRLPHDRMVVGIIVKGKNIVMGQRPDRGLLAGLWSFPELPAGEMASTPEGLCQAFQKCTRLELNPVGAFDIVHHSYSHKQVSYLPFLFQSTKGRHRLCSPWKWIPRARLPAYPYSTATRRILDQLRDYWVSPESVPIAAEGLESYSGKPPRH
jgi:A/G-specific adenine glycosylase